MRKRKKLSAGNQPKHTELWSEHGDVLKLSNGNWILFIKKFNLSEEWVNMKIAFDGYKNGIANYWFSYSRLSNRFARNKDIALMVDRDKNLYDTLCAFMKDADWSVICKQSKLTLDSN